MAMTFTSLIAPKGSAGSIMSWVNYTKITTDIETVVAEAESLIYTVLRVRQMKTEWIFGLGQGHSQISLPARYLDPIGPLRGLTNGMDYSHVLETELAEQRSYEPLSGSFAANPFGTTINTSVFNVHEVGHDVTQGSIATIAGASVVGGMDVNGSWQVAAVIDADNYICDTVDQIASSTATGGGAAATYEVDKLASGFPTRYAVWDEMLKFDSALDEAARFRQFYYRAPLPLSSTNPTNWLTSRYPLLMRKACQMAVADFMKDDTEYAKNQTAFNTLAGTIAMQDDLNYRGAEFGTDTP